MAPIMNMTIWPWLNAVSAFTPFGPWVTIPATSGYVSDWENACSRSGT